MEISHDFLLSPKGSPFLPCSGWSDLGSGNYHHCLGTSLPVPQLPRVLCPAVCTAPPCSSLFPLPWPGAIPFPIQKTAKPCAKKSLLHLPLKTSIMLMCSTPLVSNNPLILHCVPGCCSECGEYDIFPATGRGGNRYEQPCKAQHAALRRWDEGRAPANSCHLALANSYCSCHHNRWPLSRVS